MKGWNNAYLCGPTYITRNINIALNFVWTSNSPFVAGLQKTAELDALFERSASTKELEPQLMRKTTQYIFDTAMFTTLYLPPRVSVLKPFVRDAGLFTQDWHMGWEPANAWLDN